MPLPVPKSKEDQKELINRCVTDETMSKEYPRKDQRVAVCYTQLINNSPSGLFFFALMLYGVEIFISLVNN